MINKATKYGLMTIAAVLLVAMAFAGVASAEEISAEEWNALDLSNTGSDKSYEFVGSGTIVPKNCSDGNQLFLNYNLTLDFTNFNGKFAGTRTASAYTGALLGYVNASLAENPVTLTVKNTSMVRVSVISNECGNIGGIIGCFIGKDNVNSTLKMIDCSLDNCSIQAGNWGCGGLIGTAKTANLIVHACKAVHCDIVTTSGECAGGLVGYLPQSGTIVNFTGGCRVSNCMIAATSGGQAGGLLAGQNGEMSSVGTPENRNIVENCSIYASGYWGDYAGGIAGHSGVVKNISYSSVLSCMIIGGDGTCGGQCTGILSISSDSKIENCTVANTTLFANGFCQMIGGYDEDTWNLGSFKDDLVTGCVIGHSSWMASYGPNVVKKVDNYNISTAKLYDVNGIELDRYSENKWKRISYSTGNHSTEVFQVTNIGQYGAVEGYGVVPFCTTTYEANGATSGTVPYDSEYYLPNSVVTVKGNTGSLAKLGFVFSGWNKDSTTGQFYTESETFLITADTTFYANWTGNPYTVSYDANGGTGSMSQQEFVYGDAPKKLNSNTFERAGYSFAGWSTSPDSGVIYTDNQSVQNLAYGGTLPLYAVWTDKVFTVTVHLDTINGTAPYTVKLMRGNETIKENLSVPIDVCEFTAIPKGIYDIVAEDSNSFKKKVTSIVTITTQEEDVYLIFPVENVSSEVVVSNEGNTPSVVVGGLDKEAENNAIPSQNVTLTLTVQAKDESSAETNATIAISAIKDNTTGSVVKEDMQFLDINVNKTVDSVTQSVNETTELIEIIVPYDFTGKDQILVSRYHEGSYQPLTEIFSEVNKADGTYRLDRTNGMIYIYAKKFSMYSIGYTVVTPAPQYTPSSSKQTGSTIILQEGQTAPTAYATATPTVAPTVKPTEQPATPTVIATEKPTTTPKTPAPFVGILAGLGAVAVLLRMRK